MPFDVFRSDAHFERLRESIRVTVGQLVCPRVVLSVHVTQGRSHPVVMLCERHFHEYSRVRPFPAVVVRHCVCVTHVICDHGEVQVNVNAVGHKALCGVVGVGECVCVCVVVCVSVCFLFVCMFPLFACLCVAFSLECFRTKEYSWV